MRKQSVEELFKNEDEEEKGRGVRGRPIWRSLDVEMRNGLEKGGGEGRKWTWNQQGSNARDEFAVTCTRETVRIKKRWRK